MTRLSKPPTQPPPDSNAKDSRSGRKNKPMLYHHDSRSYKQAASEAAVYARTLMEGAITKGKASAVSTIEHILDTVPEDAIVRGKALTFSANGHLSMVAGDNEWGLHNHALGQVAERVGVPRQYVRKLAESTNEWERNLVAHLLAEHYGHVDENTRYLVRSVGGEARGFLSDHYRRLDSRPILESFIGACKMVGAVPVEGVATDTRVALKAMLPYVFEPVESEVMCFGVQFQNSDFGAGKLNLRFFIWRLFCTNKACLEDAMSQVHLGKKLPDDIAFSQKTYELDTETQASAVNDVVLAALSAEKTAEVCARIKTMNDEEVDWRGVSRRLNSVLNKSEVGKVKEAFEGKDVHNLPAGKSKWRLSNAISWIANDVEDGDRRMDLERLAGEILEESKTKKAQREAADNLVDEILAKRAQ